MGRSRSCTCKRYQLAAVYLKVADGLDAALVILYLVRNTGCARLFRLLVRSKAGSIRFACTLTVLPAPSLFLQQILWGGLRQF